MSKARGTSTSIALPLILGTALRELFAPFTGHPFDFELWIRIGYYVSRGGDPYVATAPVPNLSFPGATFMTWIGYPPTWAFFQAAIYKFYSLLGVSDRFVYYFLIKQPMIIGDILCGYLIYRIVSDFSGSQSGKSAFLFWMFCPLTILISSVWGMFDQIILVLVLSSVILALEPGKGALIESLGFLLKVIPLIYVPLLAFVQRTRRAIIGYLILFLIVSFTLAVAPFFLFSNWKISQLIGVGLDVTHKLGNSMNYWMILAAYDTYFPIRSSDALILEAIALAWVPALILASYFCVVSIRKSADMQKGLYASVLFITLVFFLTKSVINEQYSIYFLGFGLFDYYVLAKRDRKRLFHLIWISVLAFLVVNNTYLVRFLTPISIYYRSLDVHLETGFLGEIRTAMLVVIAIFFTSFCAFYLRSLFAEIQSFRKSKFND